MALFKDLFYPDNPKRREKVTTLYQEILDCMKDNFHATNELVKYLKKQFDGKSGIGKIVHSIPLLELKGTIKDSCDLFLKEMEKLKTAVSLLNEELAEKLDPVAYRSLHDVNKSFVETIRLLSQWGSITTCVGASIAAIVIICRIASGALFATIVAEISTIATCAIAGVAVAVVALAIDAIASAILGAIERSKLENAISELEGVLSTFEPQTRKYTQNIYEVLGAIKYL